MDIVCTIPNLAFKRKDRLGAGRHFYRHFPVGIRRKPRSPESFAILTSRPLSCITLFEQAPLKASPESKVLPPSRNAVKNILKRPAKNLVHAAEKELADIAPLTVADICRYAGPRVETDKPGRNDSANVQQVEMRAPRRCGRKNVTTPSRKGG